MAKQGKANEQCVFTSMHVYPRCLHRISQAQPHVPQHKDKLTKTSILKEIKNQQIMNN